MMCDYIILGTCNGLLCLLDEERDVVILWNPFMNLKSEISPPLASPYGENSVMSYHGFGYYDQVNFKYKVLMVVFNFENVSQIATIIYTSGENSWRTIQNFPCFMKVGSPNNKRYLGKFVSGTLNWLVKKEANSNQKMILSFDLEKETYGEVLMPEHDGDNVSDLIMDVVSNCLCLSYDSSETHWVVWLMKEYGVADSWTKLVIIPHLNTNHQWNHRMVPSFVDPLFKSENGMVIVKTMRSRLVLYVTSKSRPSLCNPSRLIRFHDLHICHESLISPQW
ncbi:unnamed protein product [Vicia faba]|uniref:F-box associated beta-propeller type 1 domain-containing protein n=1 Tax=Vicia faba TaxID=3906 RepID=A0AAV1A2S5_VICFA|nr:unnamed protein product [Vicia faba]